MIDVAVVGGGVAGSTTATVLARQGLSVTVIERSTYDTVRIGETLPPASRETLTALGVWERFIDDDHAPSFGTCAAWGTSRPQSNDFIFNPHGHGWHVNRSAFDRMLATAAEQAGAVVRTGARLLAHRRITDGWELELESTGQPERVLAHFLVDASGRAACLARANGAKRLSYDRLVGIARIHPVRQGSDGEDSFTLVEAVPNGWWYSAFLPGNQLIAVFMTDSDLRPRELPRLEARLTRKRLDGCAGEASAAFVLSADSVRLTRPAGPGWLAVGDAACAFDPLSSQGILNAMRFGMAAGEAIAHHRAGHPKALATYAATVRDSFERYLSIRRRYYRREQRWPDSAFWNRRH